MAHAWIFTDKLENLSLVEIENYGIRPLAI